MLVVADKTFCHELQCIRERAVAKAPTLRFIMREKKRKELPSVREYAPCAVRNMEESGAIRVEKGGEERCEALLEAEYRSAENRPVDMTSDLVRSIENAHSPDEAQKLKTVSPESLETELRG